MRRQIKLLLVEDSDDDALLLLRELDRQGFETTHAKVQTAATMLSALTEGCWDLVISDYSMPRFTGLEALRVMQGLGRDLPFILVSGTVGEENAVAAMKAGAHDYLIKDDLARLGEAIRRELEAAHSRAQRHEGEVKLRASEERLRTYVTNAPTAIFIADSTGGFVDVNPAAMRLLGYTREELLSLGLSDVYTLDAQSEAVAAFNTLKKQRQYSGETVLRKKDGSHVHVLRDAVALSDDRFMAFCTDVTERKQLQEQLYQAQKMESVGRLAGGVAHDFNNLLTVILSSCSFLAEELRDGDPMLEDVEYIRDAGERAVRLTRQLLAFSRRQPLRPEALCINRLLENLHKMLRRLIGEDIELSTLPCTAPWLVKADPGQIEQVVMNLVVNARDAMPEGGQLTIETANVELGAGEDHADNHLAVQPGPYVMIAVSDTGVGMSAETRRRALEPFFTTKEKGRGTGLGLSTVYGIIKQSGGTIWIYSEPGRGTTFKIYLPRFNHSGAHLTNKPSATARSTNGSETVLVVEDEEQVRKLVARMLERRGYKVLQARDGTEAQALANAYEEPIHLLLTDVIMPGPSGRVTADSLLATRPQMKVLYMSGYTDNAIEHHKVLDPGTRFVEKPFTRNTLTRTVREVLNETPVP